MTFVLKGLLWRKGGASEHKHSALESPKKVGSEQVTNGRVWVGSSSSKMIEFKSNIRIYSNKYYSIILTLVVW